MAGTTTSSKGFMGHIKSFVRDLIVQHNALVDDIEKARQGDAEFFGSATYDPANLVDGAGATTTVTVTGAVLGDMVTGVSFSLDLQGITLTAYVSAADTVAVRFQNESGGAIDLASGTIRVRVSSYDVYTGAASDMTSAKIGRNGTAITSTTGP